MADSPRLVRWSVRLYESLLKAYPAAFRKKFGGEMTFVFHESAADAWRRRGVAGLLTTGLRVIADLARTAPKERLSELNNRKGEIAMSFKSLLTRKLGSDAAVASWARYLVFGYSLLLMAIMVWKFTGMRLTDFELFFGILLAAALMLQGIAFGLLLPLVERAECSRFNNSASQIAIYAAAVLALIFGVWSLKSLAQTEYQVIVGLLLLFEVMMGCFFLAAILPLVKAHRAEKLGRPPAKTTTAGD
jgi:hypothetical protein